MGLGWVWGIGGRTIAEHFRVERKGEVCGNVMRKGRVD